MKILTERQAKRRNKILSTARELITQHGYKGVTMRELAVRSEVTPKTLYDQFGSKDQLLRTAVEERFRQTYQRISDRQIEHGIDKLFYVIEAVTASTRDNMDYAKALTSVLASRDSDPFTTIRMTTYHNAIAQIESEGDFLPWVNVDAIAHAVYRHVNPLYVSASMQTNSDLIESITRFDVSLMLVSVTRGYTCERATQTIKELQRALQSPGSGA